MQLKIVKIKKDGNIKERIERKIRSIRKKHQRLNKGLNETMADK